MSRLLSVCVALVLLLGANGFGWASPSEVNQMPTGDVMERHSFRIELESEEGSSPFARGAEWGLCTQAGITSRLEVGLDWEGFDEDGELEVNAKYLVARESERTPAVAVGLLDMTRSGVLSDWYVVLAKDISDTRVHLGFMNDEANRGMIGVERELTENLGFLADYVSGHEGNWTVGLEHEWECGAELQVYYANNNTGGDWVGLQATWEGDW